MASKTTILIALALPLLLQPPDVQAATRVSCGQVVKRSIVVNNDLTDCTGNGLTIGAPGITVDLNGHTIDGDAAAGNGFGIENNGFRRVVIEHGAVTQFRVGVRLENDANSNVVRRIRSFANTGGGLQILSSDRSRLARNTVFGNSRTDGIRVEGILIAHEANGNVISRNAVRGNTGFGILVSSSSVGSTPDRNRFSRNEVIDNGRGGILLSGTIRATEVLGNVANANVGDGINTAVDPTATLTENTASFNLLLGISAHPGVINGGGNRARGNGNPLQCRNIACL